MKKKETGEIQITYHEFKKSSTSNLTYSPPSLHSLKIKEIQQRDVLPLSVCHVLLDLWAATKSTNEQSSRRATKPANDRSFHISGGACTERVALSTEASWCLISLVFFRNLPPANHRIVTTICRKSLFLFPLGLYCIQTKQRAGFALPEKP